MNLISKATSVIIHPVRTATSVAGQTMGVAAAGARTTMRIIDRAAGQVRGGDSSDAWSATDQEVAGQEANGQEGTAQEGCHQEGPVGAGCDRRSGTVRA